MTPAVGAIDRSLMRLRMVIAVAVVVLAAWTMRDGLQRPGVAMLAGGLVVPLVAAVERAARHVVSVAAASAVAVVADTAVVVGILLLTDARPDSVAAYALALPLVEAGMRHGMRGLLLAWLATAFVIAAWTASQWSDLSLATQDPLTLIGMLLLIALPSAHMAEHLIDRVESYADARSDAEHRSELLASVLRSAATFIGDGAAAVETRLVAASSALTGNECVIVADDTEHVDLLRSARDRDGEAVPTGDGVDASVAVWLGARWGACLVCRLPAGSHPATAGALEVLAAYARIAYSTATEHERVRLDAEHWAARARTDSLTGLLNRAGVLETLDTMLRDPLRGPLAIVFVDVDGLKRINDTLGHAIGDEVIGAVAERIRIAFPTAPAGRLGGDEFVVVIRAPDDATPESITGSIAQHLHGPITAATNQDATVRVSFGVAIAATHHVYDAADLIQHADSEMYTHKHTRRLGTAGRR